MKQYSEKGNATRENIVFCAKELFYNSGYKKTQVTHICDKADVKLGTFTYYFSTKAELVEYIYSEFLMEVYTFVPYLEERKLGSLEKNIISIFLYYHIILNDSNNARFHYEVLKNMSLYKYLHNNLKNVYASIIREFNIDIGKKELFKLSTADLGVRRELTIDYFEKDIFVDSKDLITTIYLIFGRLFKIDEKIIIKYITNAIKFLNKHDFSSINFLV